MKKIRIVWNNGTHSGKIEANRASFSPAGEFSAEELKITFSEAATEPGGVPTLVSIRCDKDPFSFLLRDVRKEYPLYVPEYEVIVTEADDVRNFSQIVGEIRAKGGKTKIQRIEEQEECSFEKAASATRDMSAPTWLGITRDMRIFKVGLRSKSSGNEEEQFDYVIPMDFAKPASPPELRQNEPRYCFMAGRGLGCRHEVTRSLEEGFMPILNARNTDDGIVYDMKFFAAPEESPFDVAHIKGTDMYVADRFGNGFMHTEEQKRHTEAILEEELHPSEETVMMIRIIAANTTKAPALSYVKLPDPIPWREHVWAVADIADMKYDPETGFSYYPETGKVCCVSSLDGKPAPGEEMVVMLQPGEKICYEIKIPHRPIDRGRAEKLFRMDYGKRLAEAKAFWNTELAGTAKILLPEKRLENMIKAGLLHFDLAYFGKNPDGPVVPIVGIYTAIGSESSPGIQFLDAMGMSGLACRALQYFIEKQHEDGFMQNFGGYMLETGSVLWTLGEHFRMTRDIAWVDGIRDNILRACRYLIQWREQNLQDRFRGGKGYGMIDGKTSDPEDPYHSYMLNAGAYVGLSRAAEMLEAIGDGEAAAIGGAAEALKMDILETLRANIALSQLIPMGDGTWTPSFSPWAEATGPVAMLAKGGKCYSHGSFVGRDMTGAIYLILQEVIPADDPLTDVILKLYTEHLCLDNTLFSQPYYSPHPFAHMRRGEVKPFLKEFYSGVSSLADRETYTFWEHYYHMSSHKLHEEAWFLMRCRWMLFAEEWENKTLHLLSMAPRKWMEDGKSLKIDGMRTYFGSLSLRIDSDVSNGKIRAEIRLLSESFPAISRLTLRLPHPDCAKAKSVSCGRYDPEKEIVVLDDFRGSANIELQF